MTKQQLEDIEQSRSVSPTNEVLSTLTKIAGSTGGSLILFLALLPLVLKNLTGQLPQLAAIFATVSEAIKDPSKVAEDIGEGEMMLYYKQQFRAIMQRYENSRIWGSRRVFPGVGAIR